MRFGFTPLYIDESDVMAAVAVMETIFRGERWRDARYAARSKVT
jgi:kynureninase